MADYALPSLHVNDSSCSSHRSRRPTGRFGESEVILRVNPSCEHMLNIKLQRLTAECDRVARQLDAKRRKFIDVQWQKQRKLRDDGVTGVSLMQSKVFVPSLSLPHIARPKETPGADGLHSPTEHYDDDGEHTLEPVGGRVTTSETIPDGGLLPRRRMNRPHLWTADNGQPTTGDPVAGQKRHSWQFGIEFAGSLQPSSLTAKADAAAADNAAAPLHQQQQPLLQPRPLQASLASTGGDSQIVNGASSVGHRNKNNRGDIDTLVHAGDGARISPDAAKSTTSAEQKRTRVAQQSAEGDPRFILLLASLHRRSSYNLKVAAGGRRPSRRSTMAINPNTDLKSDAVGQHQTRKLSTIVTE